MFDVPPPDRGVRGLEAYRETWPSFCEWQRSGALRKVDGWLYGPGDEIWTRDLVVPNAGSTPY